MQLINGDCLEVMKNIPDKSVDMILCDLPYGTTACKWDKEKQGDGKMTDKEIQASDEEMEQFNVLQNEKCVLVKTEKLNDLKNRISFALKDATLQQGFEIICKRIAELEKENEELKENALVWHDLRKAPNDLPEERGDYWIKYDNASEEKGGFYDVHYFEPNKPFYKKHWSEIGVMTWCRLPKFEE